MTQTPQIKNLNSLKNAESDNKLDESEIKKLNKFLEKEKNNQETKQILAHIASSKEFRQAIQEWLKNNKNLNEYQNLLNYLNTKWINTTDEWNNETNSEYYSPSNENADNQWIINNENTEIKWKLDKLMFDESAEVRNQILATQLELNFLKLWIIEQNADNDNIEIDSLTKLKNQDETINFLINNIDNLKKLVDSQNINLPDNYKDIINTINKIINIDTKWYVDKKNLLKKWLNTAEANNFLENKPTAENLKKQIDDQKNQNLLEWLSILFQIDTSKQNQIKNLVKKYMILNWKRNNEIWNIYAYFDQKNQIFTLWYEKNWEKIGIIINQPEEQNNSKNWIEKNGNKTNWTETWTNTSKNWLNTFMDYLNKFKYVFQYLAYEFKSLNHPDNINIKNTAILAQLKMNSNPKFINNFDIIFSWLPVDKQIILLTNKNATLSSFGITDPNYQDKTLNEILNKKELSTEDNNILNIIKNNYLQQQSQTQSADQAQTTDQASQSVDQQNQNPQQTIDISGQNIDFGNWKISNINITNENWKYKLTLTEWQNTPQEIIVSQLPANILWFKDWKIINLKIESDWNWYKTSIDNTKNISQTDLQTYILNDNISLINPNELFDTYDEWGNKKTILNSLLDIKTELEKDKSTNQTKIDKINNILKQNLKNYIKSDLTKWTSSKFKNTLNSFISKNDDFTIENVNQENWKITLQLKNWSDTKNLSFTINNWNITLSDQSQQTSSWT